MKLSVSNKLIWSRRVWDRVLSSILALAILGALGTLGYIIATPRLGDIFTDWCCCRDIFDFFDGCDSGCLCCRVFDEKASACATERGVRDAARTTNRACRCDVF